MTSPEWPPLPFSEWESTCDTLHMWTQIVGKTRMALAPMENHWWNVTFQVTPRGLRTPPIPFAHMTFDTEFDLIGHRLTVRTSEGVAHEIPLFPRPVADFYAEYMSCLRSLAIEVSFDLTPAEFDDATPHDRDRRHASYDAGPVENFRRVLVQTDRVLKQFRSRFCGKCSPVHFFWGSFDLAVSRFSGRVASLPKETDHVTREAYSHEVISCGFWPGDRRYPRAAFYSYTAPAPAGIEKESVRPGAAHWDNHLSEFVLNYDDVRASSSPNEAILDFCQSTYEAGAKLARWDRDALERHV